MIERALSFGPQGRLTGVLTEPSPDVAIAQAPAILLWNVGVNHHVGPYRFNVDMARGLAKAGFLSLRFDLSGLGDSETRRDAQSEMERALVDLGEAMTLLEKRCKRERFIPLGFCSSVDAAHKLALGEPRVVGACFVEGYSYRTQGFYLRYPLRFLQRARWRRVVASRAPSKLRKLTGLEFSLDNEVIRGEVDAIYVREYPSREQLNKDYQALVARDVRLLFIYAGGDTSFNHESQFFEILGSDKLKGHVQLAYYPQASHTFYAIEDRQGVIGRVTRWMVEFFGRAR